MRHAKQFLRLNTPRRRAAASHLVGSLLEHEQIRTTLTKAKVTQRMTDRMITLGKAGTLASQRQAAAFLGNERALRKLFQEIGKRYQTRAGGYTRLVRDFPRKGDGSPMAIIELIDRPPKPIATEKPAGKEKKKAQAGATPKKQEAVAQGAK